MFAYCPRLSNPLLSMFTVTSTSTFSVKTSSFNIIDGLAAVWYTNNIFYTAALLHCY